MVSRRLILLLVLVIGLAGPHAASASSSTDTYKVAVQRLVDEALNKGNLTALDESLAPDYSNQGISGKMGLREYKDYLAALRAALPDFQAKVEVMLAEGDVVASRLLFQGTFKNKLVRSEGTLAPNGKAIRWALNVFHRFDKNGKIAEEFFGFDQLSLLAQLDAAPGLAFLNLLGMPSTKSVVQPSAKTKDMEKAHKEGFQRFIDQSLNQGNIALMDERFAADYVGHDPFADVDRTGFKRAISLLRSVIPDLNVTAEIMIAEGDWAAARLIYRGTFKNKIEVPFVTVTPTNKPVQFIINVIVRFNEKGEALEDWKEFNRLNWLQQVGVLPATQ